MESWPRIRRDFLRLSSVHIIICESSPNVLWHRVLDISDDAHAFIPFVAVRHEYYLADFWPMVVLRDGAAKADYSVGGVEVT